MALLNDASGELTARLVYYGPGLAGKTTNLRWIYAHLPVRSRGKLVSIATHADRTLFFEFVPLEPAPAGLQVRVQLYAVPGQVSHESARRMVLKGCDAVVFVADSQAALLDANAEALRSLQQNLLLNGVDLAIPRVIQYNKRDLPTALPLATLEERLNPERWPRHEAVACDGEGVEATLLDATRLLLDRLAQARGGPAAATKQTAPEPVRRESTPASARLLQEVRAAAIAPPDDLDTGQWAYLVEGARHGPVTLDQMVELVLGTLREDTLVFRPGLAGWARADELPEIAAEIPPPVPVPGAGGAQADGDMPDFRDVPSAVRSVLVADEDAAFRRYLALPLAAQGFAVHEAADGAAAWQLALSSRPWIVLADVSMPELDGFELCRRLRAHPLLSRRPLLFISRSDAYHDRHRALQAGADDFLSKSTPIRELLIRVRLLMARYSDLSAATDPARGGAPQAFEGRLEVLGVPALLEICGQARLTGVLTAAAEPAPAATIGWRSGEVVSARLGDTRGVEAVYAFLTWTTGRVRFTPGDPGPGLPLAPTFEHLLFEGCRRLEGGR